MKKYCTLILTMVSVLALQSCTSTPKGAKAGLDLAPSVRLLYHSAEGQNQTIGLQVIDNISVNHNEGADKKTLPKDKLYTAETTASRIYTSIDDNLTNRGFIVQDARKGDGTEALVLALELNDIQHHHQSDFWVGGHEVRVKLQVAVKAKGFSRQYQGVYRSNNTDSIAKLDKVDMANKALSSAIHQMLNDTRLLSMLVNNSKP